ncbi:putative trypanothione synthetase [Trypanosoma conorhini]|uniref:Putative trypanothione synthetase n=1 Tax=Trypanosoma conorhini TaxID=83891 RepID=A0A3R7SBG6_9TRYP|nr:putative trypanothione synthetase [Trypanosoma conorhini]RNF27628.1 putative trypanothione synthetase [Trypanosoma conorhini]
MCGQFDFGYDGKEMLMLEYNRGSSSAMLECGGTQEKMARRYGVELGTSTGSFLYAKIVKYFKCLLQNRLLCPSHKLIHFVIDGNGEEWYTALYATNAAEAAGFRAKLCFKLADSSFGCATGGAKLASSATEQRPIVELEEEWFLLVWKTWAWDTVLLQYTARLAQPGSQRIR